MFKRAIVRTPGSNFAEGLTTVDLGVPRYGEVLRQHAQYCAALTECGLEITTLEIELRYPDSTFVEDTAVVTPRAAILMRPGARSREGEVETIRGVLGGFFPSLARIEPPGTVDGGDICEAEDHFFLGLSQRSNREGLSQLAELLSRAGYTSTVVDIREMKSILHLKSGISFIGGSTLVVMDEMAENPLFHGYELIRVGPVESYGANCVRVNDRVLMASGHPRLQAELERRGFHPLVLEMSEFQKMDGGLSCLSLRF